MAGQLGGTSRPRAVRLMKAQRQWGWVRARPPYATFLWIGPGRNLPYTEEGAARTRSSGPGGDQPFSSARKASPQPLERAVPEVGHDREQGTMPLHARGRSDARAVPAGTTVRDTPAPCLSGVRNFLAASDGWLRRCNASFGPESFPPPERKRIPSAPATPFPSRFNAFHVLRQLRFRRETPARSQLGCSAVLWRAQAQPE